MQGLGISQSALVSLVRDILDGEDLSMMTLKIVRQRVLESLDNKDVDMQLLRASVKSALTVVINSQMKLTKSKQGPPTVANATAGAGAVSTGGDNASAEKSITAKKSKDDASSVKPQPSCASASDGIKDTIVDGRRAAGSNSASKDDTKIGNVGEGENVKGNGDEDENDGNDDGDDDDDDDDDDFNAGANDESNAKDDEDEDLEIVPRKRKVKPQSDKRRRRVKSGSTDHTSAQPFNKRARIVDHDDEGAISSDEFHSGDDDIHGIKEKPNVEKKSKVRPGVDKSAAKPSTRVKPVKVGRQLRRLNVVLRSLGLRMPPSKMGRKDEDDKCRAIVEFLRSKGVVSPQPHLLSKNELSAHRQRLEREKDMVDIDTSNIIEGGGRTRRRAASVVVNKPSSELPSDLSGPELSEGDDGDDSDEYAAPSDDSE